MGSKFTDSPWFWLYLFGMSGLMLLWISAPTWIERQTRWERRRTARETIVMPFAEPTDLGSWGSADPQAEVAARDAAITRWRTLVTIIAVLATVGAIGGWWRLYRGMGEPRALGEDGGPGESESAGETSPRGKSVSPMTRQ